MAMKTIAGFRCTAKNHFSSARAFRVDEPKMLRLSGAVRRDGSSMAHGELFANVEDRCSTTPERASGMTADQNMIPAHRGFGQRSSDVLRFPERLVAIAFDTTSIDG